MLGQNPYGTIQIQFYYHNISIIMRAHVKHAGRPGTKLADVQWETEICQK